MRIGLTRRGLGALVGACGLYAAGEWLGFPLLRAWAVAAFVALAATVLMAARPLRLTVERTLDRTRVHRGQDVTVTLTVHNSGRWWQPGLRALDAESVTIPALRGGRSTTVTYRLPTRRRGRISVGPLRTERADPFGLTDRRRRTGAASDLWVYPRIQALRPVPGAALRRPTDLAGGVPVLRGSLELQAVRQYVAGDEPRHIHWRATAATGGLMVRDLRDPAEPGLTLLCDDRTGDAAAFEEVVDVAASVLLAAASAGYRVRLLTWSGIDVTPRPGPAGIRQVLDTLCTLAQRPGPAAAPRFDGTRVDETVVVVTGRPDAAVAWPKRAGSGRRILVELLAGATKPARVPGVLALRGPDAVTVAAQWNTAVP